MARVLNLLDVFELIVDAFDDRALAQSQLIHQWHEFIVHVLSDFGDQVQTTLPEFVEEALRNVATISNEFTRQALGQIRHGLTVINIAVCDPKREPLAAIIDDEMELESEKPAHGSLAASRDLLEQLVAVDAPVVANHPGGRIHEGNAGILAVAALERDTQRHQGTANHRRERHAARGADHRDRDPPALAGLRSVSESVAAHDVTRPEEHVDVVGVADRRWLVAARTGRGGNGRSGACGAGFHPHERGRDRGRWRGNPDT